MRKLFYLVIVLCGLAFNSCEKEATLGKEIAGEWTAGSTTLPGISAANAVTTDNYLFTPDSSYVTGNVEVVGMFNITLADSNIQGVTEGVSTSVSGKSTAYGTYTITSHDEMLLNFVLDSISVELDPTTVVLETNTITSADSVQTGAISATQAQVLKAQVLGTLQAKYAGMRSLDDVKVKGNTLKFEVLDTDYILTR